MFLVAFLCPAQVFENNPFIKLRLSQFQLAISFLMGPRLVYCVTLGKLFYHFAPQFLRG